MKNKKSESEKLTGLIVKTASGNFALHARDLPLQYLQGKAVSLASFPIDLSGMAPFQQKVLTALKKVGWGNCLSYSAPLRPKQDFPVPREL